MNFIGRVFGYGSVSMFVTMLLFLQTSYKDFTSFESVVAVGITSISLGVLAIVFGRE